MVCVQAVLDGKLRSGSQRGGGGLGSTPSSSGAASLGVGKRGHGGEVWGRGGQGPPPIGAILKRAGKGGNVGAAGGGSELIRSNSAPNLASCSTSTSSLFGAAGGGRLLLRSSTNGTEREGDGGRAGSRGGLGMHVARAGDAECVLRREGVEGGPHSLYARGGGENDALSNWGSEVSAEEEEEVRCHDHVSQEVGGRCNSPLFGAVGEQHEVAAGVEEGCDAAGDRKDPLLYDMD